MKSAMSEPRLIRQLKKIIEEKKNSGGLISFDEYRAKVSRLLPPYSEDINRIIIYHFLSQDSTRKQKVKETTVPYKGKVATGEKLGSEKDKTVNLLYDFEQFPEELQELLLAYVGYLASSGDE